MALGCAVVAHAIVVYAVGTPVGLPPSRATVASSEAVAMFDVQIDPSAIPDAPAAHAQLHVEPSRSDLTGAARPLERTSRTSTTGALSPPSSVAAANDSVGTAAISSAPDDATSTWSLRTTRVDIGVTPRGGARLLQGPGVAAATADGAPEGKPRSTTGGLVEALDAHDVAMGLGRGGPVRSAVENAVQAANVMGSAVFEVRVESSGRVSVGVRDVSEDAPAWSSLSETIRKDVLAKRGALRLPPGAQGLIVVVRAEAKDRLPDGRPPSRLGTHVDGTAGSIHETAERVEIKLPSVTLAHEGKVCAAGLHVGLDGVVILGGCSPENIGTHPTRIVAARIESEARL